MQKEDSMTAALLRPLEAARPGVRLLAIQALLVAVGTIASLAVPGGIARAVLVLPVILWVPGRSLVAALGLSRPAGPAMPAVAVVLSIVALIALALTCNAVTGRVPLHAAVSLVLAAVALPLNLLERTDTDTDRDRDDRQAAPGLGEHRARLRRVSTGVGVLAGLTAVALLVAGVVQKLPGSPQAPYLQFAFGAPYAQAQGVQSLHAGQHLSIPVHVDSSDPAGLRGLAVTADIDGKTVPGAEMVALRGHGHGAADATVSLIVPPGCLHRIGVTLHRADTSTDTSTDTVVRTLSLYGTAAEGLTCARP
jgi:hypothetical protein